MGADGGARRARHMPNACGSVLLRRTSRAGASSPDGRHLRHPLRPPARCRGTSTGPRVRLDGRIVRSAAHGIGIAASDSGHGHVRCRTHPRATSTLRPTLHLPLLTPPPLSSGRCAQRPACRLSVDRRSAADGGAERGGGVIPRAFGPSMDRTVCSSRLAQQRTTSFM